MTGALLAVVLPATTASGSPGPTGTVYVTDSTNSQIVPVPFGATSAGTPIVLGPGTSPTGIEITSDAGRAYVADSGSDKVSPVTLSSQTVGRDIALDAGADPQYLAVSPGDTQGYVADEDTDTVTPINLNTNQPGTPFGLADGAEPVAVAFTPKGTEAFVADFGDGTVTPIDVTHGRTGTPIKVGNSPSALSITPDGKTLYVVNQGSGTVTPIDVASSVTKPEIKVGPGPDGIAITPDGATAYVANFADDTVTPISLGNGMPGNPIGLGNGSAPSAVAVSPDGSTAYVTDFGNGGLSEIATATNTVARTVDVGGNPLGVAVTPDQGATAHLSVTPGPAGSPTHLDASGSTQGSSAITNYHFDFGDGATIDTTSASVTHVYATAGHYTATVTLTDAAGSSTTAVYTGQMTLRTGSAASSAQASFSVLGPTAGASPVVYVANYGTSNVTPIATQPAIAAGSPIGVDPNPTAIAISPDGATGYAVNSGDGTVVPIDLATNATKTAIGVGNEPSAIAITPDGTTAYVANQGSGSLSVITLKTGSVSTITLPSGSQPDGIAIDPSGTWVYVADVAGDGVVPVKVSNDAVGTALSTGAGSNPAALAVAPDGSALYVAAPGTNSVQAFGIGANGLGAQTHQLGLGAGSGPSALAVNPDGKNLYVTDKGGDQVVVLSLPGLGITVSPALPSGSAPDGVAVTPDGSTAFVAESSTNKAVPISLPAATVGTQVTVGNVPDGVAITPDQAPVAKLAVTPALAASPTQFDAGASSAPSSPIVSYAWDFGDGTTVTTATSTTTHTYAKPGDYTATVTLTDAAGTSTTQVFTGQTVSRNGDPGAKAAQSFHIYAPPPTVTSLNPSSGPYGQSVTITGTWLYFATVTFGVVTAPAADVTVAADGTSLTVKAPTGPPLNTPVNVVVSTPGPNGPQNVTAGQFTYTSGLVSPVVTSLTPSAGPVGTAVAIVGSQLDNATVTFGSAHANVTSNTSGEVDVKAPSGSGTVTVVVSNSHGTVGAGQFTYTGGSGAPKVTGLNPTSGVAGDHVTITGTGLTTVQAVSFGGQPAHIVSKAAKSVVVTAPAGAGTVTVVVSSGSGANVASSIAGQFTYTVNAPSPVVTGFTPASGAPGDSVTITGTDLGNAAVDFGGVPANVTSDTATQIVVTVPAGVGIDTVTVVTAGGRAAAGTFDYLPTVTAISPDHGVPGTSVTITGTNLGQATSVTFDGTSATITSDTATKIVVKAPAGAVGSDETIVVTTPGGTATAVDTFHYDTAAQSTITGFTPTHGTSGTAVTITGTNLTGATSVTFDGAAATISSDTATKIVVNAPAGVAGSDATIVLTAPGGTVTAPGTFHYDGTAMVTVTSISPTRGLAGTRVTITGSGLGAATAVTFGPFPAVITSSSANRLTVIAPNGIRGTAVTVTVFVGATSDDAPQLFHYTQ